MNRSVGMYEGGVYVPHVHDGKAIVGYDQAADKFYFIATDDSGAMLCRQMVVDVETLEWVPLVGGESTPVAKYILADMDTTSDPSYYGHVDKGGGWYILRLNDASGQVRYARGASGYTTAWTARAAQTYDYFSITF